MWLVYSVLIIANLFITLNYYQWSFSVIYHINTYLWFQGQESSQDEKAAAALHAVHLDDQYGGAPVQVSILSNLTPWYSSVMWLYNILTVSTSCFLMQNYQDNPIASFTWHKFLAKWYCRGLSIHLYTYICDWACDNWPCECKFHRVIFLLISSIQNVMA